MNPQHRTEERPIQLESARQRVVAAVTAVSEQLEETPPAARNLKSQQALIIAGLENLVDVDETQTRGKSRTASAPLAREAWIDQLPFTD